MLEHSSILSTYIKLSFVFKTFVLSIFECSLKTGFTTVHSSGIYNVIFMLMVHVTMVRFIQMITSCMRV